MIIQTKVSIKNVRGDIHFLIEKSIFTSKDLVPRIRLLAKICTFVITSNT